MKRRFRVSGMVTVGVSFEVDVDLPDDLDTAGDDAITDHVFDHVTEPGVADLHVVVGGHTGMALMVKGPSVADLKWHTDGCCVEIDEVEDLAAEEGGE